MDSGAKPYDYRNTVPHSGYEIVSGWRQDKMKNKVAEIIREKVKAKLEQSGKSVEPSLFGGDSPHVTPFANLPIEDMAGSFYCFTSNVTHTFMITCQQTSMIVTAT